MIRASRGGRLSRSSARGSGTGVHRSPARAWPRCRSHRRVMARRVAEATAAELVELARCRAADLLEGHRLPSGDRPQFQPLTRKSSPPRAASGFRRSSRARGARCSGAEPLMPGRSELGLAVHLLCASANGALALGRSTIICLRLPRVHERGTHHRRRAPAPRRDDGARRRSRRRLEGGAQRKRRSSRAPSPRWRGWEAGRCGELLGPRQAWALMVTCWSRHGRNRRAGEADRGAEQSGRRQPPRSGRSSRAAPRRRRCATSARTGVELPEQRRYVRSSVARVERASLG